MNVLVYDGPGAAASAVQQTLLTLRLFLEPYYAVSTISPVSLASEPWISKTAAIVFPGGADLPYIQHCKRSIPLIKKFVAKGGTYIGFCAGAYFGSSRVEFEIGKPIEVQGNRDLRFFPGIARGSAFPGFRYNSDMGARTVILQSHIGRAGKILSYFNGGPVFVDAHLYDNVEILATYNQEVVVNHTDLDSPEKAPVAAVVLCDVGKGKVLLSGPHLEYESTLLKPSARNSNLKGRMATLKEYQSDRIEFTRMALIKAGLRCNGETSDLNIPALTPGFICSLYQTQLLEQLVSSLKDNETDNVIVHKGENDELRFLRGYENYDKINMLLKNEDPDSATKWFLVGDAKEKLPPAHLTPRFNISKYFANLDRNCSMGSILMYGEIVSSTSTLLDNNKTFLSKLPDNSVLYVGTTQLFGRGRGNNAWISTRGVSSSTVCVSVPSHSPFTKKPVSIVFMQYLSTLAYCEAILSYAPGYEDIPVRVKWPNDLYALTPEYYYSNGIKLVGKGMDAKPAPLSETEQAYVKISGLLVNTHFAAGKYTLLLGCGLNISNEAPTTSLKIWVEIINRERFILGLSPIPEVEEEKLLALYMKCLDKMIDSFLRLGTQFLLPRYYRLWLHTGQIVTLTDHNSTRAKITGITSDYGLLLTKELKPGSDMEYTGNTFSLQPDGNSFDIFRGLISTKN
ncbi:HCL077Wp [Eremothecium sinecaudum]|uniref:HCL077Wp n=1 Tax=Eremothecium sinecaudum TaxID=45286 RepID=A0A0X8HRE8_9SACH|nr:HCL077Wp [Eremothecium sinecaudum]AMD20074.1 HCL077Wp [Eremothecium sinecaudum]